jgi:hypothetical protein
VPDSLQGPLTVRLDLDDPVAVGERDGVEFPPPSTASDPGSASQAPRESQQALGATPGSARETSEVGRIFAAIVALVLILAVAIAAVRHRHRTDRRRA